MAFTAAAAPPGGIRGATGYRYWTITIDNLEQSVNACKDAGYKVVVPDTEFRAGKITLAPPCEDYHQRAQILLYL